MKKRVNIYPRGPITTTNPPIRVPVKNVTKDVKDIRKCIVAGAKVEEILDNGTLILLNLNNYDAENKGTISTEPEKKPDAKVEKEHGDVISTIATSVDVPEKVETKEVIPPEKPVVPEKKVEGDVVVTEDPDAPREFHEKDEEGNLVKEEAPAVEEEAEEEVTEEETEPVNEVQHLTKRQRKALRAKERAEVVKTQDPEESVE